MDSARKAVVVTGAARGIGKAYTQALLHKGYKVRNLLNTEFRDIDLVVAYYRIYKHLFNHSNTEIKRHLLNINFPSKSIDYINLTKLFTTNWLKVCMSDINDDQGRESCKELQKQFDVESVFFVKCDVTCQQQVEGLMKAAVDKFKFVEIMVNNAGVMREDDPFFSLDVNLNGVIRGMAVAMEHMRQDKGGRGGVIVNTSSMAVFRPLNFLPTYTAAKCGVVGYCKSWATHPDVLNNGIKIVCICPAAVDTDLINIKEEHVRGIHLYRKLQVDKRKMSTDHLGRALIKVLEDKDNNGLCLKIENIPDSGVTMTYA